MAAVATKLGCQHTCADVAVGDARLVADPADEESPASIQFETNTLSVDGKPDVRHWVLAESHWAASFSPPPFSEFARWALRILPLTTRNHFSTKLRRTLQRLLASREKPFKALLLGTVGLLLQVGFLFAGLALASVVQLLVLVLLLLAAVPIDWLRSFLLRVQQAVATSLGDSYVLLENAVRGACIVSQVQRDLRWLASRCERVVVVAHSQGAAVAHQALKKQPLPEVKRLITFGSGLSKLQDLRLTELSGGGGLIDAWLMLLCELVLIVLGPGVLKAALSSNPAAVVSQTVVSVFLMALFLFLFALVFSFRRKESPIERNAAQFILSGAPEPPAWSDYFASADPVPNGSLFDTKPEFIEQSQEVFNLDSPLRDHTAYWENVEGFVGPVAVETLAVGGVCAAFWPGDDRRLEQIVARRRWRVQWLRAVRWTVFASFLLLIGLLWRRPDMPQCDGLPGLASMGKPIYAGLARLAAKMPSLAEGIVGDVARLVVPLKQPATLGLLAMAGAAWLWMKFCLLLWRRWGRRELNRLHERKEFDFGGVPFVCFCLCALLPPAVAAVTCAGVEATVVTHLGRVFAEPKRILWPIFVSTCMGTICWQVALHYAIQLTHSRLGRYLTGFEKGRRFASAFLDVSPELLTAKELPKDWDLNWYSPARSWAYVIVAPLLLVAFSLLEHPTGQIEFTEQFVRVPVLVGLLAELNQRFFSPWFTGRLTDWSLREPPPSAPAPEVTGGLSLAALAFLIGALALLLAISRIVTGAPMFIVVFTAVIFSVVSLQNNKEDRSANLRPSEDAASQGRLATRLDIAGLSLAVIAGVVAAWHHWSAK
ncbi:MAG: hypothetical protein EXS35_13825 [Pedosphaera sp.]|nr:hypothetical protein [Pedosphaera sp.]